MVFLKEHARESHRWCETTTQDNAKEREAGERRRPQSNDCQYSSEPRRIILRYIMVVNIQKHIGNNRTTPRMAVELVNSPVFLNYWAEM